MLGYEFVIMYVNFFSFSRRKILGGLPWLYFYLLNKCGIIILTEL